MNQITATGLQKLIESEEDIFLLDVREAWEYEICAINSSVNIPMPMIPSSMNEIDPEQHVIVMCHHGMRSLNVAEFLLENGYEKVSNMKGGIHAWAIEVDSKMEKY